MGKSSGILTAPGPISCVSVTDYKRCSQESVCRFRHVMREARNLVADMMDSSSLEDVLKASPYGTVDTRGLDGEGI